MSFVPAHDFDLQPPAQSLEGTVPPTSSLQAPLSTAAVCQHKSTAPESNLFAALPKYLFKHALQHHSLHHDGLCLVWFHYGRVLLQVERLQTDVKGKHAELLALRKALEHTESQVKPCAHP